MRRLFLKLETLMYVSSCSVVHQGPPTPLSILVRASLRCSVKGVVHSVVRDLEFLGNFSHEIAFISQNIIAKWFSNDQLAFYNDKRGLVDTTQEHRSDGC